MKAALSAAAEHLAGLLPLHLVYSKAHETAVEVFLKSHVGLSVFLHLSPFHITLSALKLSYLRNGHLFVQSGITLL